MGKFWGEKENSPAAARRGSRSIIRFTIAEKKEPKTMLWFDSTM
jgi:hypothetical protein